MNHFTVLDVAHHFWEMGNDESKTQKLLYYAQCTYIMHFGKKLFDEKIIRQESGPVVMTIHDHWGMITHNYETKFKKSDGAVKLHLGIIHGFFKSIPSSRMTDITNMSVPVQKSMLEITPELMGAHFPSTKTEKDIIACFDIMPFALKRITDAGGERWKHDFQEVGLLIELPDNVDVSREIQLRNEKYIKSLSQKIE